MSTTPSETGRESLRTSPDEESPLLAAAPTKPADDDVPVAQELSFAKLAAVMGSIYIGTFFAALDGTVLVTLLAPISDSFDSFASISWITTAFLIATAAVQPLAGKMTDIYGRRRGLLTANTAFGVGTLMCAFAQNEYVFIAGRVLAGGGGGGMFSISTIVSSDLIPLRKRGIAQGFGNIAWGAGSACGGIYGGFISDRIGWRWAFILQLPFIVLSAVCVAAFVRIPIKKTEEARHRRVDYLGSFTLVSFLVLFLLALNTGGSIVPWNHPLVYVSLPTSLVVLLAFFYVERKAKEPIIPLEVLGERTVLVSGLCFFFTCISVYVLYFFCPMYFMLRGETATTAGLRMMPFAIGISCGSLGSGFIMNHTGRYYILALASMVVFNLGVGLITTFSLSTPTFPQFAYFYVFGLGYGAILTVGMTALIAAVAHANQAVSTSSNYLFRATGCTIGTAVGTAVFQTVLRARLLTNLGNGDDAQEIIARVTASFEEVFRLQGEWKRLVVESYMQTLHAVFFTSLGFGIIAMVIITFIREHKLHRTLDRKGDDDDE